MSKSTKSKNATLKKVKKLERQGKYLKALKVCDVYLDNNIAEETLILLKIDILVEYYNNEDFIALINEYKIKLTNFLNESEEIELLKIYNTLDNYLELKTQNLASEGIVKSYLAGGLLIDNLETILVLNEMVKDNYDSIKSDAEYIENKIPHDLRNFVDNVSKTSYQYLELILPDPKEQIANSNFDLDKIRAKLRKFLEPKDSDENAEETSIADENNPITEETPIADETTDENNPITEETPIADEKETTDENNPITEETESTIEENEIIAKENETTTEENEEILEKIAHLEEKSVVTLGEINNLENEEEEDLLKVKDDTEFAMKYSIEDEINSLKDIIARLNDKNEFKKALTHQRKLVKLAREKNIKSKIEHDSKQKTLFEF